MRQEQVTDFWTNRLFATLPDQDGITGFELLEDKEAFFLLLVLRRLLWWAAELFFLRFSL